MAAKFTARLEGSFAELKALADQHGETLPAPVKALLGSVTRLTNETTSKGETTIAGVDLAYDLAVSVTE